MIITFILARADNGVIGRDGSLPWHLPADLKRFKALTMGKPMLMGRKTFESFPAALPGRRHLVVTRDAGWSAAGAEVFPSIAAALDAAETATAELMVIGGAEIFEQMRAQADRVELTEVHAMPDGDVRVGGFDEWDEIAREDHPVHDGRPAYSFVTLGRPR